MIEGRLSGARQGARSIGRKAIDRLLLRRGGGCVASRRAERRWIGNWNVVGVGRVRPFIGRLRDERTRFFGGMV